MNQYKLTALLILIALVENSSTAVAIAQSTDASPVRSPAELIILKHEDGRRVVCELVGETEDDITVERLVTGRRHTVAKTSLGKIVRNVSDRAAIDSIGLVEFAAWSVMRVVGREASPASIAVLPVLHRSGRESPESRRLTAQLTNALIRRKAAVVPSGKIAEAVERIDSPKLLELSVVQQVAREVDAARALVGTISQQYSKRETLLRLVTAAGRTELNVAHGIRTDSDILDQIVGAPDSEVLPGAMTTVAFSPNGRLLAAAGENGGVRIWETSSSQSWMLDGIPGFVQSIAFSRSGDLLASVCTDGTLLVTDLRSREEVRHAEAHEAPIRTVTFSANDRLIATGGDDSSIKIWKAGSSTAQVELSGHTKSVRSLAFAPKQQLLASASNDRSIKLWDPMTGRVYATLWGHSGYVYQVVFSPDGRQLVSASGDGSVRIWDLSNNSTASVIQPRAGATHGVAFSADGRLLATSHANETIMLWNAVTQDHLLTISGADGAASQLAFSPDDKLLAAACGDGHVRTWKVGSLLDREE